MNGNSANDESTEEPTNGRPRSSSQSTRPSVSTTSFYQQSFQGSDTTSSTNDHTSNNEAHEDAIVSADQERQVLLLMLLAQVCALHDATPKTFTIHVVELFERGILDRESIHFLFELGLVPSLSPTRRMLTSAATATPLPYADQSKLVDSDLNDTDPQATTPIPSVSETTQAAVEEIATELALTTANGATTTTSAKLAAVFAASNDPQRSAEAYTIRATLAQYESLHQGSTTSTGEDPTSPLGTGDAKFKPWDVKHFPLSLSRYQREFLQKALLASGSFGQVYHATRKMDGCDYAIKKVDFDATGYSNQSIQEVVREVECLAKVSDHVNVVRYYTSWLEPSWMTGGNQTNGAQPTQPEHKLLTNMIHSASNDDDDDDVFPADISDSAASDESSESSSTFDQSSNRMWARRRFSFGSSVESVEESWDPSSPSSFGRFRNGAVDDSYCMNRTSTRRKSPRRASKKATPAYRYQISLYIQMQLCHPATLADWIRERNKNVGEKDYEQRVGPALEIFEQIARGLAHVHSKGVIHRDLKPANIFASKDGQVIKIGDFGLSKQLENLTRGTPSPTKTAASSQPSSPVKRDRANSSGSSHQEHWNNAIVPKGHAESKAIAPFQKALTFDHLTVGVGTRSYAAPEQLQTKSYSTAADIFSLGLIFLELVCCFETEHERLHNFQECREQNIQPWIMEIYPDVGRMILACTRKDPAKRPTAAEIVAMLALRKAPYPESKQIQKDALQNALLRRSLELRDEELEQQKKELAEKDQLIERLRLEMDQMKSSLEESSPS